MEAGGPVSREDSLEWGVAVLELHSQRWEGPGHSSAQAP